MKKKIFIFSFLLISLLATCFSIQDVQLRTCIRVIDGDTIELEGSETVRLIGVDTPETVDPRKPVQRFGREACDFTRRLVEGKAVRLEYDLEKEDKYRRTLAYIFLADGTFVNAEIIRQGYGFAYTKYAFKYLEEFRRLEREARENQVGLWGLQNNNESQSIYASQDDETVYITRSGKKYHRGTCGYLRKSKIPISLSEACERGYGPCSRCSPPPCPNALLKTKGI